MTKARMDGLYLMMMGCAVFLLLGTALEHVLDSGMGDFKAVYYSSRCLLEHSDPYKPGAMERVFLADGGQFPADPVIARSDRRAILLCINMPATLLVVAPFALLAWGPAHIVWMAVTAGLFILAAFLMWDVGARHSPVVSGALIGLILLNSELLIFEGNMAGIVISLCIIAVWCFLEDRFVAAGILFLALGLATKPHDAGLVWLYFLLAGGVYRKRALQTLAVAAVIAIPAILWVSHVAPHWMQEQFANLAAASARGDLNDPGPTSMGAHNLGGMINLQTVIGYFWDDPRFYNPATYLVCAPFLLVWALATIRSRFTPAKAWLALAAIAALSMLPVYHRQYDAKLLLLAVPACAILWAEGGRIGKLAGILTTLCVFLTGDLTWAAFMGFIRGMHVSMDGLSGQVVTAIVIFPVPIILLIVGAFYLWVYARREPRQSSNAEPVHEVKAPAATA